MNHFQIVAGALLEGRVVPFLGAGVNLSDTPTNSRINPASLSWSQTSQGFPSGRDLARLLATDLLQTKPRVCQRCGVEKPVLDLTKVSQDVVTFLNEGPLYHMLHTIFAHRNPAPTTAHAFLASVTRGPNGTHALVVTTNYDDLMEQAFANVSKSPDIVFFNPGDRKYPCRFYHRAPGGDIRPITDATGDSEEFCKERPTVLKIHGTVDRDDARQHEAWVITEDDYIDYLADQPLNQLLPARLLARLQSNHLLLLGYSLRDWNFRVFLRRLQLKPSDRFRAWAVVASASTEEKKYWSRHEVDVIEMNVSRYLGLLNKALTRERR